MDQTSPRWVYCENVDFYFLFEMLCICLLQAVWGVDDALGGGGGRRTRLFSTMRRLWIVVVISCTPWVLAAAAAAVVESCAERGECKVGVLRGVSGYVFEGSWGG